MSPRALPDPALQRLRDALADVLLAEPLCFPEWQAEPGGVVLVPFDPAELEPWPG